MTMPESKTEKPPIRGSSKQSPPIDSHANHKGLAIPYYSTNSGKMQAGKERIMQAMICVLGALVVMGLAISRNQQPTSSRPTAQRTDIDGIAPHIERAAALLYQLRELDDLQTSLELCAPRERAQALRLEWVNHNGSTHTTSVWMDGSSSTGDILAATIRERQTIRAALLDEIRAAYSGDGVTETIMGTAPHTVTETRKEGAA